MSKPVTGSNISQNDGRVDTIKELVKAIRKIDKTTDVRNGDWSDERKAVKEMSLVIKEYKDHKKKELNKLYDVIKEYKKKKHENLLVKPAIIRKNAKESSKLYNAVYEGTPFSGVRWLQFPDKKIDEKFKSDYSGNILIDGKERVCYGVKSPWDLKLCMEKNPEVKFFTNSDYIENHH